MMYIVTGLPAHGTTLMMKCLEAGGIPVWEEEHVKPQSYEINFQKFYTEDKRSPGRTVLPYSVPRDECLKAINHYETVKCLWPGQRMKVIAMSRMTTERDTERSTDQVTKWCKEMLKWSEDHRVKGPEDFQVVNYNHLLVEPNHVFRELARAGWPIDHQKAAALVDPLRNTRRGRLRGELKPVEQIAQKGGRLHATVDGRLHYREK